MASMSHGNMASPHYASCAKQCAIGSTVQWKAFVNGLPTFESEQVIKICVSLNNIVMSHRWFALLASMIFMVDFGKYFNTQFLLNI